MAHKILLLFLSIATISPVLAGGKLVSGPIQGHTTTHSMRLWILVKHVDSVVITLFDLESGERFSNRASTASIYCYKKQCPVTVDIYDLLPDRSYSCEIQLGDRIVVLEDTLKTFPDKPVGAFSFMIGSCAVSVPNLFKPLHPGNEDRIYKKMLEKPAAFMLWLGDYLYYMFFQYRNYENMLQKNISKRKKKRLHEFLVSRPQYAVWDDHDYGPNDGDSKFALRDTSLQIFRQFWPNKSYGLEDAPGCFFNFEYLDTEYFMTDNRYYRTHHEDSLPVYFGSDQLSWLKQGLKNSKAVFKFVVSGSQVLNKMNEGECFLHHKEEVDALFGFIKEENITGVIFLSGDRHFTELLKEEREHSYPFYEFTNSPITSIGRRPKNMPELSNPQIVPGTLALRQNFGVITVSGEKGNRSCLLETFDNKGNLEWQYTISESELR